MHPHDPSTKTNQKLSSQSESLSIRIFKKCQTTKGISSSITDLKCQPESIPFVKIDYLSLPHLKTVFSTTKQSDNQDIHKFQ